MVSTFTTHAAFNPTRLPIHFPKSTACPEVEETIVIESDLSPPCNCLIRHYSNITPVVECCTNHAI